MQRNKTYWTPGRKRVVLTGLFVCLDEVYFCDFVYTTGKQLTDSQYLSKVLQKKRSFLNQPFIRVYQLKNNEFTDKKDFSVSKIHHLFNFCITVNKKVIFENPTLINCIKAGNLDFLRSELVDKGIEAEVIDYAIDSN